MMGQSITSNNLWFTNKLINSINGFSGFNNFRAREIISEPFPNSFSGPVTNSESVVIHEPTPMPISVRIPESKISEQAPEPISNLDSGSNNEQVDEPVNGTFSAELINDTVLSKSTNETLLARPVNETRSVQ